MTSLGNNGLTDNAIYRSPLHFDPSYGDKKQPYLRNQQHRHHIGGSPLILTMV